LALLPFSLALAGGTEPRYRLTPILDPAETLPIFIDDVNDAGAAVGGDDATDPANRHAIFWWHGIFIDLHRFIDPAAVRSEASGINNRFDIAGTYVDTQGANHGFLLRRGRFVPVETGADLSVDDVNNKSQITGLTFDSTGAVGYVWDSGSVTILPPLEQGSFVLPREINDRGVVVGTSGVELFRLHAVIWRDGQAIDLGVAPGFADSRGNAINDRGQVVGVLEGQSGSRAFIWHDGNMTVLPPLRDMPFNAALDINNKGDIVGVAQSPQLFFPVLWRDGVAIDLNTLIDENDPLQPFVMLASARLINNRGQIIATGSDLTFYLLTPKRQHQHRPSGSMSFIP
jgi:probable HAF family extracellular repeat protein